MVFLDRLSYAEADKLGTEHGLMVDTGTAPNSRKRGSSTGKHRLSPPLHGDDTAVPGRQFAPSAKSIPDELPRVTRPTSDCRNNSILTQRLSTNVTLRQLWAFLCVAEAENFTAAADVLCLTQSAVSNLIKELERELGLRLFDRTTRSVQLTNSGREFLVPARRVFAEFRTAMTGARALSEKMRHQVTVAATPLVASLILPAAIADFHSQHPQFNVVLRDAPYGQIVRMVQDGEAELGFTPLQDTSVSLAAELLASDDLGIVFPTGHPLSKCTAIRWRDITEFPFIALTSDNGTRQLAERCAREAGVTLQPAYEVSFIWTALSMVEAGLGVCLLPGYVRFLGKRKTLAFGKLEPGSVKSTMAVITRTHGELSMGASHFRAFIRGLFR